MKKEIKEKWIKELRSGKHRQTTGKLKARNGAMCCLGVLEHVVLGEEYEWWNNKYVNKAGDAGNLPIETLRKCELSTEDESLFVRLNDDERYSFEEIADHIEENYD